MQSTSHENPRSAPLAPADMEALTQRQVLDAIHALHGKGLLIDREALRSATSLPMQTIDNHVRALIGLELVRRTSRGTYVPTRQWPEPRPISKTILSTGQIKIEIGDEVLTLTPQEERNLASLQGGALAQLTAIESNRQAQEMLLELARAHRLQARSAGRQKNDD